MPPAWKIARELTRIRDRNRGRLEAVLEKYQRRNHDRNFEANVQVTEGLLQPGSKIAIFVLYQPKGLARSVEFTCRHLIANGYTPMIVSNGPLREEDVLALHPFACRIVRRPNFGYDFGAYRDGIFMLWKAGLAPETLVLMNDSTWFPLRADDGALAQLDERNAAFSGFAFKQEPFSKTGAWHVESHFLRFSRSALESDAFREFWTTYQMSSNRITTIMTGEKGISRAMMNAGFHPFSLVCYASFQAWFVQADSLTQKKVLTEATFHIPSRAEDIRDLLADYADTQEWRLRAIAQVNDLLFSLEFFLTTTFAATTMVTFGVPFLKKSSDDPFRVRRFGSDRFDLARRQILELNDQGKLPGLDPIVAEEIRTAVKKQDTRSPVTAQ